MKSILFMALFIISINQAHALKYEISHPCSESLSAKGELVINDLVDALTLTQSIAKNHSIKIEVIESGIKGFFEIPKNNNLEILSDISFRAYGWCYSVNGQFPDVMPKDYLLQETDQISWFLGSSTYLNGQWIDYCTPVTNDNTVICK